MPKRMRSCFLLLWVLIYLFTQVGLIITSPPFFFIYFIFHCRVLLPVLLVVPFNLTVIYLIVGGNGKLLVVTVAFLPFQV